MDLHCPPSHCLLLLLALPFREAKSYLCWLFTECRIESSWSSGSSSCVRSNLLDRSEQESKHLSGVNPSSQNRCFKERERHDSSQEFSSRLSTCSHACRDLLALLSSPQTLSLSLSHLEVLFLHHLCKHPIAKLRFKRHTRTRTRTQRKITRHSSTHDLLSSHTISTFWLLHFPLLVLLVVVLLLLLLLLLALALLYQQIKATRFTRHRNHRTHIGFLSTFSCSYNFYFKRHLTFDA